MVDRIWRGARGICSSIAQVLLKYCSGIAQVFSGGKGRDWGVGIGD